MPRTPNNLRPTLEAAAARLHEVGSPDLAEAVESLLTPTGWGRLRRATETTVGSPNLPIFMNKEIRETLKAIAEAKGATLTADVAEGFRKFLAGEFVPDAPIRSRRNSGAEKVNLNVSPDPALVQQVLDVAEETSAEYGWKVTPARVASAYLMQKYRIPEAEQAK